MAIFSVSLLLLAFRFNRLSFSASFLTLALALPLSHSFFLSVCLSLSLPYPFCSSFFCFCSCLRIRIAYQKIYRLPHSLKPWHTRGQKYPAEDLCPCSDKTISTCLPLMFSLFWMEWNARLCSVKTFFLCFIFNSALYPIPKHLLYASAHNICRRLIYSWQSLF